MDGPCPLNHHPPSSPSSSPSSFPKGRAKGQAFQGGEVR
jgi:hypothetical protein